MHGHNGLYAAAPQEAGTPLHDEKTMSDMESDIGAIEVEKSFMPSALVDIVKAPVTCIYTISWRALFTRLAMFFLPSFLQGRCSREWTRPAKLHPTAYLDGMRGLAALFVFFCHYSYQGFRIAESYGCADRNWAWLKLPIIRLFYQGPAAVCLFFVISGYALSYRPLKLIRSGSTVELSEALGSLVFRRAIRLFLPPIISTFMIICFIRLGAYEWTREFATNKKFMKNIVEPHPHRLEGTSDQFLDWIWSLYSFIHVFSWNPEAGRIKYDIHLWTIPVEYLCSLYLFLVLMATARLSRCCRILTVTIVAIFVYRSSRWDFLLFLAGMLIAELDLISGVHNTTSHQKTIVASAGWSTCPKRSCSATPWIFLSIVALYFLSQPDANGHMTPGWIYLCSLVPKWWSAEGYRYWQSIGAVLFVFVVGRSTAWQRLFNSNVVQYLGKISYALYLMHGPAMHVVGYHFEKWAYSITGVEGYWFNAGFVLHACFCIPTVIWWADIFWRAVDIPTVRFAKWFERKCIAAE